MCDCKTRPHLSVPLLSCHATVLITRFHLIPGNRPNLTDFQTMQPLCALIQHILLPLANLNVGVGILCHINLILASARLQFGAIPLHKFCFVLPQQPIAPGKNEVDVP